jgi:hypothetical protein
MVERGIVGSMDLDTAHYSESSTGSRFVVTDFYIVDKWKGCFPIEYVSGYF